MTVQNMPPAAPTGLRVNLLSSPFGMPRDRLRFSWHSEYRYSEGRHSETRCPEGRQQTAYRLRFAVGREGLTAGVLLHDTGWVDSTHSTGIAVPALEPLLKPDTLCYWQVAVRDGQGRETPFSAPAPFSTAMDPETTDTRGIWSESETDFLFLRREVTLTEAELAALDRATVTVTALSPEETRQYVYNLYLNGHCVGVGPSRLGRTPDGETALYFNTYDVTSHLRAGENALAALCYTLSGRRFFCRLLAHFTDGTTRTLACTADGSAWRVLDGDGIFGKDNSIGTHYFTAHACNLRMSLFPEGFAEAGFDDSVWSPATVYEPIGETVGAILTPAILDPVTRYGSDPAALRVTRRENGNYLVDLGREIIGGFRWRVSVPNPCAVTLRYGEQLNPDGSVKYRMNTGNIYTETWHLRRGTQTPETVGMMAFRYVEIENSPVAVNAADVTGTELRAPFDEEAAAFESDNLLLNRIYGLVRHTVKVTTQDILVDSQSRERGAYEGDLLINLPALWAVSGDHANGRFSAEYLYTHRTWPADYILLATVAAYEEYMTTGDTASLEAYYPVLREKTFTDRLSETYGLVTSGNPNHQGTNAILVDWPSTERDGYEMGVTYNTVLNALAARAYAALAEIARVLGHGEDAETFSALSERVKSALIRSCYDEERGCFRDGLYEDGTPASHASQHATAFALYSGIYTDPTMAHRLAAFIEAGGEIRMSVYGAYFLLMGLYRTGHGELANRLLLSEDTSEGARTWAYMLEVLGATVTTEAWNMTNKPNMTLSHPWGAAPAAAITEGIFGIAPTAPGYERFTVRPCPCGVGRASIRIPTVKGCISAAFDYTAESPRLWLTVPDSTAATLSLPAPAGATLLVDGVPTPAHCCEGHLTLTLGSGDHTLTLVP